jgi:hypothetical protein
MGVNCYSHEKNSGGIKTTRKNGMRVIKGKEGKREGRGRGRRREKELIKAIEKILEDGVVNKAELKQ